MSETRTALPEFIVLKDPASRWFPVPPSWEVVEFAAVQCPRANCRETFWVRLEEWTRAYTSAIKPGLVIYGRSCPYCFATSFLPGGAAAFSEQR